MATVEIPAKLIARGTSPRNSTVFSLFHGSFEKTVVKRIASLLISFKIESRTLDLLNLSLTIFCCCYQFLSVLMVDAKTAEQPSVAHGNRGLWTILLADGMRNAIATRLGSSLCWPEVSPLMHQADPIHTSGMFDWGPVRIKGLTSGKDRRHLSEMALVATTTRKISVIHWQARADKRTI